MNPAQQNISEARRISARIKPSRQWIPMRRVDSSALDGCPVWQNDLYTTTVRHHADGWPLGGGEWIQLGIYCEDGEPRHDFRAFQRIKNDICGSEWEAIELYPAESRLVDPSNYYLLWCAPSINIGMKDGRTIAGPQNCIAPQRGWAKGDEPLELRNNGK